MVPLHGTRRATGRGSRAPPGRHRPGPHRDLPHAPRTAGGRGEDRRLLRAQPTRKPRQAAPLSLELQDALRQDLCRLPAGPTHGLDAPAGTDLQARRAKRLGNGPADPPRLRGLAVRHPRRHPHGRGRGQGAPRGVLRLVPGPAGTQPDRRHQGTERMDTPVELGLRHPGRISLRSLARARQGPLCRRGPEGTRVCRGRRTDRLRRRHPAHHYRRLPLPVRHSLPRHQFGRIHRRANLQLDLQRRAARQGCLDGTGRC